MSRADTHGAHLRDFHKPSKKKNGEWRQLPKPPDSKPIWDPLDPFIIEYQNSHRRVVAAWRGHA